MIEIIHKTEIFSPKVSLIFLDWSCRESLHSLDFLEKQTVSRDQFEIIFIEYYSRRYIELDKRLALSTADGRPSQIDQWIIMDLPNHVYYHKHLMYNVGIAVARGEIITISDSDAMYSPTFIETILETFALNDNIVLHMDQVRNNNRKFYPYNFPTFDELTDEKFSNFQNHSTIGLQDFEDPIHSLNYGACMSAKRADLIEIGGADEHLDYLGHICGPYDMTFRLANLGLEEIWHGTEMLFHTWHPGQAGGEGNYIAPHDGRHFSARALQTLETGRILPAVENQAIEILRTENNQSFERLKDTLINPEYFLEFSVETLKKSDNFKLWVTAQFIEEWGEFNIIRTDEDYLAIPKILGSFDFTPQNIVSHHLIYITSSLNQIRSKIDDNELPFVHKPELYKSYNHTVPTLADGYLGFNFIRLCHLVIAVPQYLGNIDVFDVDTMKREDVFLAETEKNLIKKIEKSGINNGRIETYEQYNIVQMGGQVLAFPMLLGTLDYADKNIVSSHLTIKGESLEKIHILIDKFMPSFAYTPEIYKIYKRHVRGLDNNELPINLIRLCHVIIAVPQYVGNVDVFDVETMKRDDVFLGETEEEILKEIEQSGINIGRIEEYEPYNIVQKGSQYFGFPMLLNHLEIMDNNIHTSDLIIKGESLQEIHTLIDKFKPSFAYKPEIYKIYNLSVPGLDKNELAINLIRLYHVIIAVPQYLKDVDIIDVKTMMYKTMLRDDVFSAETEEEVIEKAKFHFIPKKIPEIQIKVREPAIFSRTGQKRERIDLLFSSLSHQNEQNFISRGGLDVLEAFSILQQTYSNVYLTLRDLPAELNQKYKDKINWNRVHKMDQFFQEKTWERILRQTDIYLLPFRNLDVPSIFEAMSFGTAQIVTDVEELTNFIRHGENGIVIPGRCENLKQSQKNTSTGPENLPIGIEPEPKVVRKLVKEISNLVENPKELCRLQMAAYQSVKTDFDFDL